MNNHRIQNKVKVTMVLSRCDQTGMTINTLDLITALLKYKNEVDLNLIIGHNPGEDEVSDSLFEKFKATGVPIEIFYPAKVLHRKSVFFKIKSVISLLKTLRKAKGIIHMQSPYLTWAPWVLCKKYLTTMHTTALHPSIYYKNADHLIAISKETKDYAKAVFGYKDKDISTVLHGVSPKFSVKIPEKDKLDIKNSLRIPTDKIIITLVGTIEHRKGQDILIKAVMALPEEVRKQVHIVLVGSDNHITKHRQKWLDDIIQQEQAESIVSQFPYQDPFKFYQITDIFVLPSWTEGFPLVTLEAMLSGCLVIRSDAEGASEQIINGHTGYIFRKGAIDQLTEILKSVIIDSDLRDRISKAGRKYADEHFTSDVMARNTIEVYRKINNSAIE